MKYVTIFDTSVASDNTGDVIIMDAVRRELEAIFPTAFFASVATHDPAGRAGREHAKRADFSFVGGTNLLCPHWFYASRWKIGIRDFYRIGHPILMGVGWNRYSKTATDIFTKGLLQFTLNGRYVHAVRDSYTKGRLEQVGVTNVVNTGCPTMWSLTPELCATVPPRKASRAVTTLTCFNREPDHDRAWLELVCSRYDEVFFWPQMFDDAEYFESLRLTKKITMLGAPLSAFDDYLSKNDADFIGTRLHGGIRALQHRRRTIILQIDNRATEITKDTGLPSIPRGDLAQLRARIDADEPLRIQLPMDAITRWRTQFN